MTYGLTFRTAVVLKDVDVEVEVEYVPGINVPARLSGHPDSWRPDESQSPEFIAVRALLKSDKAGKDVLAKLSREVMSRLRREAWKAGDEASKDGGNDEPYEPDYEDP